MNTQIWYVIVWQYTKACDFMKRSKQRKKKQKGKGTCLFVKVSFIYHALKLAGYF